MPVNGNVISTAIAIWTGSDIYVSPSFVFWAEAGPDAWDTLIVETTRSYANRYHVDYIKILLNNEWIQGADQTDFDFPACDYPLCDFYFPYSDVADWRLGLLESIGGQDALDSAVLEAAALDHGQSAQSSETTEKYLIYFVDPENERDPAGWCSEFASWAIREGTELETPVSSDSDTSIAVSDMWDYFETESRETVFAEDVWDSVGSCVQPGDYVSRDNWSHSALFVGWVDGFDDEEDINYIWVIECNVGWWDQQGGTTVGGGWRTHARISYDEDTQFSVCGPDADWVDCDVKLCLDGYNPGPDPGAPNTGEECDLFGSTAS
jgi:hypothetical protein